MFEKLSDYRLSNQAFGGYRIIVLSIIGPLPYENYQTKESNYTTIHCRNQEAALLLLWLFSEQ
jgi:hypothetical protein